MTINFTTTDTTFTIILNGVTQGTWDKLDEVDKKFDISYNDNVFGITLSNPFFSRGISSADTLQINGEEITGTNEEKIEQLKDDVFYLAPDGSDVQVAIYQRKIILIDAQIKALPTTPIELVPAPPDGKFLIFHHAIFRRKPMAASYNIEEGDVVVIESETQGLRDVTFDNNPSSGGTNILNTLLGSAQPADDMIYYDPAKIVTTTGGFDGVLFPEFLASNINNSGLLYIRAYSNDNANWTGGHAENTLEVTVFYSIVDL